MAQKFFGLRKITVLVIFAFLGTFVFSPEAFARLIFTTEEDGVFADQYSLDKDGTSTTNIDLVFGSSAANYLRYDIVAGQFLLSQDLSLNGNELKNFRIVNAASPEASCAAGTKGQMYFDTDDNLLYVCNGTDYISTSNIADDSITGTKLADAVAGAGLIKDGSENLAVNVDDSTIEINADTLRIKAGGIGSNEIGTNAIGTDELADNAVDAGAIATGAVGSDEIGTDAVGSDEISAGAVGSSEIGTNAVGSDELADDAVDAGAIATGAVGADEIGADAVTTTEIDDDTITLSDLAERNATVTIAPDYPNFTLYGDSTNNSGTMESDYSETDNRSFFKWSTKTTTTAQDYDIIVQWQIPENFTGWQASNPIQVDFKTNTTDTADNKADITILDTAGASATLSGNTNLKSSVADTWVNDNNISITGGTWTAGQNITLKIKMFSKAIGSTANGVFMGAINFNIKVK